MNKKKNEQNVQVVVGTPENRVALTVQGEPVETVVNATGAGDAFMGGLVYA